jgi:uncharacterized phage-associated protein
MNVCDNKGKQYGSTKIQKLLYILYGTWLCIKGESIVNESPIALPFGLVFGEALDAWGKYKSDDFNYDKIPQEIKDVTGRIVDEFGDYSAEFLSDWSHEENSPWWRVLKKEKKPFGSEIDDENIRKYFEKKVIQI